VILGASFDTVDENRDFASKFNFPFRLLCDTDRAIGLAYGACEKATDTYPKRISYIIGPDGTVRHAFPKVDPKTHPTEVLKLLQA